MEDVTIIGGGAAGLAAAAQCALALADDPPTASARIGVYEATDKVGRPILRSGNGRCNFSHLPLDPRVYYHADFVAAVLDHLERHSQSDSKTNAVLRFFETLGVVWRPEDDGRLYPLANRSSVVLDALLRVLRDRDVQLHTSSPIRRLVPPQTPSSLYTLELADGTLLRARRVIVACGHDLTASLMPEAVTLRRSRPVLGPLRLADNPFKAADGQRLRCLLMLRRDGKPVAAEYGEGLFRAYGISGIAAMNLSRQAQPGDELIADFLPDLSADAADANNATKLRFGPVKTTVPDAEAIARTERWLAARQTALAATSPHPLAVKDLLCGLFSRAMGEVLATIAGLRETTPCDGSALAALSRAIRRAPLSVAGIGPKDACQVHRGGVAPQALDPTTLEVVGHPGLHMVGEAVDVDGPCGGYNLHWAWASALVAAAAVTRSMQEEASDDR